ncbi:hypothetical protein BIV57_15565 [Mangrovactinospora gilvigrisea]|uniref:YbjN domain-containing protein n=1 Tax=Mangrovactinospora gilvigrisea TaxID=1428644 RepID=A0A1J7C4T7_9ACTN|nr:YbjN domain-containing protein [Mangrovactinospora gilvigrisea]OIV36572.1 hypothetical protein BIV57_15565 [Mangrovactinospora gilvigrisea]
MSIDPAGLPNFGAEPSPNDGGPETEIQMVRPDQDLIKQLLDQLELKYGVDEDGDLVAPYEGFRVVYMFRGEQGELFMLRTYYDREFPIEERPTVLDALDQWNRDTLWPKAYTHTREDGKVFLATEYQLVTVNQVNLDFFVSNLASWMDASIRFDGWIAERLGLEQQASEGEGGKGGDDAEGDAPQGA